MILWEICVVWMIATNISWSPNKRVDTNREYDRLLFVDYKPLPELNFDGSTKKNLETKTTIRNSEKSHFSTG